MERTSNSFTLNVQYCKSCETHNWCTHHDQQKYLGTYRKLKQYLEQQFGTDIIVQGNVLPQDLLPIKPAENKYLNARTSKYVTFPAIGAFEVMIGNQVLFSKKKTNAWPNFRELADRVHNLLTGNYKNQKPKPSNLVDSQKRTQSAQVDVLTQKDSISMKDQCFLDQTDEKMTVYKAKTHQQQKNFTLTDHFKNYHHANYKKQHKNNIIENQKSEENFTIGNSTDYENQNNKRTSQLSSFRDNNSEDLEFQQFKRNFQKFSLLSKDEDYDNKKIPQFLKKKGYIKENLGKKEMIIRLDSIQQESMLVQDNNASHGQNINLTHTNQNSKSKSKGTHQKLMMRFDDDFEQLQQKFKKFQQKVQTIRLQNKKFDHPHNHLNYSNSMPKIKEKHLNLNQMTQIRNKQKKPKQSRSQIQENINDDIQQSQLMMDNPIYFAKRKLKNIEDYINGTQEEKNEKLKKIYGEWKLLKRPFKSNKNYISPYKVDVTKRKSQKLKQVNKKYGDNHQIAFSDSSSSSVTQQQQHQSNYKKLPRMPTMNMKCPKQHLQQHQKIMTQDNFYPTSRNQHPNKNQVSHKQMQFHRASAGVKINTFDNNSHKSFNSKDSEFQLISHGKKKIELNQHQSFDSASKTKISSVLKSIPKKSVKQALLKIPNSKKGRQMSPSSKNLVNKVNENRIVNDLAKVNKGNINMPLKSAVNQSVQIKRSRNFRSTKKNGMSKSKSPQVTLQNSKKYSNNQDFQPSLQSPQQQQQDLVQYDSYQQSQSLNNNFFDIGSNYKKSQFVGDNKKIKNMKPSQKMKKGYEKPIRLDRDQRQKSYDEKQKVEQKQNKMVNSQVEEAEDIQEQNQLEQGSNNINTTKHKLVLKKGKKNNNQQTQIQMQKSKLNLKQQKGVKKTSQNKNVKNQITDNTKKATSKNNKQYALLNMQQFSQQHDNAQQIEFNQMQQNVQSSQKLKITTNNYSSSQQQQNSNQQQIQPQQKSNPNQVINCNLKPQKHNNLDKGLNRNQNKKNKNKNKPSEKVNNKSSSQDDSKHSSEQNISQNQINKNNNKTKLNKKVGEMQKEIKQPKIELQQSQNQKKQQHNHKKKAITKVSKPKGKVKKQCDVLKSKKQANEHENANKNGNGNRNKNKDVEKYQSENTDQIQDQSQDQRQQQSEMVNTESELEAKNKKKQSARQKSSDSIDQGQFQPSKQLQQLRRLPKKPIKSQNKSPHRNKESKVSSDTKQKKYSELQQQSQQQDQQQESEQLDSCEERQLKSEQNQSLEENQENDDIQEGESGYGQEGRQSVKGGKKITDRKKESKKNQKYRNNKKDNIDNYNEAKQQKNKNTQQTKLKKLQVIKPNKKLNSPTNNKQKTSKLRQQHQHHHKLSSNHSHQHSSQQYQGQSDSCNKQQHDSTQQLGQLTNLQRNKTQINKQLTASNIERNSSVNKIESKSKKNKIAKNKLTSRKQPVNYQNIDKQQVINQNNQQLGQKQHKSQKKQQHLQKNQGYQEEQYQQNNKASYQEEQQQQRNQGSDSQEHNLQEQMLTPQNESQISVTSSTNKHQKSQNRKVQQNSFKPRNLIQSDNKESKISKKTRKQQTLCKKRQNRSYNQNQIGKQIKQIDVEENITNNNQNYTNNSDIQNQEVPSNRRATKKKKTKKNSKNRHYKQKQLSQQQNNKRQYQTQTVEIDEINEYVQDSENQNDVQQKIFDDLKVQQANSQNQQKCKVKNKSNQQKSKKYKNKQKQSQIRPQQQSPRQKCFCSQKNSKQLTSQQKQKQKLQQKLLPSKGSNQQQPNQINQPSLRNMTKFDVNPMKTQTNHRQKRARQNQKKQLTKTQNKSVQKNIESSQEQYQQLPEQSKVTKCNAQINRPQQKQQIMRQHKSQVQSKFKFESIVKNQNGLLPNTQRKGLNTQKTNRSNNRIINVYDADNAQNRDSEPEQSSFSQEQEQNAQIKQKEQSKYQLIEKNIKNSYGSSDKSCQNVQRKDASVQIGNEINNLPFLNQQIHQKNDQNLNNNLSYRVSVEGQAKLKQTEQSKISISKVIIDPVVVDSSDKNFEQQIIMVKAESTQKQPQIQSRKQVKQLKKVEKSNLQEQQKYKLQNQSQLLHNTFLKKQNSSSQSPQQKSNLAIKQAQISSKQNKKQLFYEQQQLLLQVQQIQTPRQNKPKRAAITKQFYGQSFKRQLKMYPEALELMNLSKLQPKLNEYLSLNYKNNQSSFPVNSEIGKLPKQLLTSHSKLFDSKSLQISKIYSNHPLPALIKCLKILSQINEFLIIRLFQNPSIKINLSKSQNNIFGVWLCINYQWKCIIINLDQLLLDRNNQKQRKKLYYLQHRNNQLWPIILQKALAIALKGYDNLASLPCYKLFSILTGSNSLFFNIKQDPTKNSRILRYISDCQNKNFVLHAEKVCKNLDQLQVKQKQSKIWYVLSQKLVNDSQIILQISQSSTSQSTYIKLTKFVREFKSLQVLQLRLNHNFTSLPMPKAMKINNLTIIQLEFIQESFGSISISTSDGLASSMIKTFLYKQEKSNVLKLIGQAKENNKSTLFFDCYFSDCRYYLFVQTQTAGRVTYLGENQPLLRVVEEVNSQGLKNDYTEYLPVKSMQIQEQMSRLSTPNFESLGSKMPRKLNKNKFGQTGMSFRSQQDKISRLRETFVQYLLNTKDNIN